MSNIEKIRQEIERRAKFHDNAMKACPGLNNIALTHSAGWKEDTELLSFIDSLPEEKPSEDLEEAAREWAEAHYKDSVSQQVCADDFIAGANWMRKKDVEDMYLSDNRHFLKCYEQGKVDMKVEMMKDAVEGEIGYWNQRGLSIRLDKSLEKLGYDMDTKVKIVIVKEDDRPRD